MNYFETVSDGSLEPLYEICESQNVGLNHLLTDKSGWLIEGQGACYTPSDICMAVVIAGQLLRENPGRVKLAQKEIELPAGSEPTSLNEIALSSLVRIINCTVSQPADMPAYQFYSKDITPLTTCDSADKYFAKSMDYMQSSLDFNLVRTRFQVLHDGVDAVGFRKNRGNPTTLFFEHWASDGIVYPPGSIAALKTKHEDEPEVDIKSPQVISIDDVDKAGFLRLSSLAMPGQIEKYRRIANRWLQKYMP